MENKIREIVNKYGNIWNMLAESDADRRLSSEAKLNKENMAKYIQAIELSTIIFSEFDADSPEEKLNYHCISTTESILDLEGKRLDAYAELVNLIDHVDAVPHGDKLHLDFSVDNVYTDK